MDGPICDTNSRVLGYLIDRTGYKLSLQRCLSPPCASKSHEILSSNKALDYEPPRKRANAMLSSKTQTRRRFRKHVPYTALRGNVLDSCLRNAHNDDPAINRNEYSFLNVLNMGGSGLLMVSCDQSAPSVYSRFPNSESQHVSLCRQWLAMLHICGMLVCLKDKNQPLPCYVSCRVRHDLTCSYLNSASIELWQHGSEMLETMSPSIKSS
ncbi:hypothetical protein LZ32DRAFT_204210 [Colletotrichum eremochloae]|nr:hypothetical protein LZ32DRAFT_204210 [Colletotrichum eremochloae]